MARADFQQLGARPFVQRIDQELAACGLTPAPRSSLTASTLTPQEVAVARLVASGRTNREVAGELALSVKTVEYHLGHVFTKLGVASRSQLAAASPSWPADAFGSPGLTGWAHASRR